MIFDHQGAKLSALDLEVVKHVPPGGNWRNLPEEFASKRIAQIRKGAAAGEGSRSTYYGRLRWNAPAYTISTYFNRPGNGCFIHPEEGRLITVREAARLQSFPDHYRFSGMGRAKYLQVGNAVPPLLAFAIAGCYSPGSVLDLFCGAGGLSLGFELAGHKLIAAVDSDRDAINTFQRNRPSQDGIEIGDLSSADFMAKLVRSVSATVGPGGLDFIVGGPPCQGFSTAGKNELDDRRNSLMFAFLEAVKLLKPAHVVIENVPALMWKGRVGTLATVRRTLEDSGYVTDTALLHAEGYGVPQLRRRLIILGSRSGPIRWPAPHLQVVSPAYLREQPGLITPQSTLRRPRTVRDAISDLPAVAAISEQALLYPSDATTEFQAWMRGDVPISSVVPRPVTIRDELDLFATAPV